MAPKKDERDVARFLCCLSILEEKVANAYKSYSENTENPRLEPLLLFVSYDSLKHSKILKSLSEHMIKQEPTSRDCEQLLGKTWKNTIIQAQGETQKTEKITDEEIAQLIDKMINLENFLGEEYLTVLHLRTVQLVSKELQADAASFSRTLEWIIADEKRHVKILGMIKNIVGGNNNSQDLLMHNVNELDTA